MPVTTTITRLTSELRTDRHLRREAESMWLYVSIVLLSALSVFDDDHPPGRGDIVLLEIGTTAGLVLAHGFASWVSARLTSAPPDEVDSWDLLWVQLGGALALAVLSVVAVVVAPASVELPVVNAESRPGRSTARAAVYGLLALAAGATVALAKSLLAH